MEAATAPLQVEDGELAITGPEWDEFVQMMEDTTLTSDLVRIDWLLERVAAARAEIAENNAVADARIAMQEDFRQGENARIERKITWLVGEIGTLAPTDGVAMKAEYSKKSRTLAHGTFGFKSHPDSIAIDDAKAALAFAVENSLPVKTVHSVTKTTLKDHAKATGESEGGGWRLVPGADAFFVTPAK